MARWNDLPWREDVYKAAVRWRERCFFQELALFNDDAIWTYGNFDELWELTLSNPIYDNPLNGNGEIFIQKLRLQLVKKEKASIGTIQLAAELLFFIYLVSTRGTELKAQRIREILSWHESLRSINIEENISMEALRGIASPGQYFGRNIYKQWVFLLSMLRKWKSTSIDFRSQFRPEARCWEFANWWDQEWITLNSNMRREKDQPLRIEDIQPRPQVWHWLMFALYPNRFERIVSLTDKKLICRDLSYLADAVVLEEFLTRGGYRSQVAIDRLLREIRTALEPCMLEPVDFYSNSAVNALWGENTNIPAPSNKLIHKTLQVKVSDDPNAPSYDNLSIDHSINPKLEGKPVLRKHYVRERDHTLRERKLDEVSKIYGSVFCYCCGTDGTLYGDIKLRIFEVHHHIPLSKYDGAEITNLSEVSVLCANCHRAVHATNPPTPVEELSVRTNP